MIHKNDHRTLLNGYDNSMLIGLTQTFSTVEQVDKIPVELGRICGQAERVGPGPYRGESIPLNVREVLYVGGTVWKFLKALNFFSFPEGAERIAHLKELVKLCETLSEEDPG